MRHRAQEISDLVSDPRRVAEEREKARANKAKYTGVSAAEMRGGGFGSGGGGGFSSGAGSSGRRFDPASLVRPGQPTPGSSSFSSSSSFGGGSGTGGRTYTGGGGSAGYVGYGNEGASSRGRASGPASPSAGGGGRDTAARADALEATRARIEKLRAQAGPIESGEHGDRHAPAKKKLTDVRVNPKIAASLGLKPVTAAPRPAASSSFSATSRSPAAPEIDLLGGLDDPEPALAASAVVDAGGDGGGWDAFGEAAVAPDAPVADPFAILEAAPAPSAPVAAASPPAAGHAMPVPPRGALSEDLFADLTGLDLNKPQAPMGVKSPSAASPAAGASADPFGFADFSAAPAAPAAPLAAAPAVKDPFSDLLG